MILQNDSRIKSEFIHKEGCALMSIFFWLNQKKGIQFSPAKIDIYYTQMKEAGCFTETGDVYWEEAFRFFDVNVKMTRKDDPKYRLKKNEFAIAAWYNERTNFTHFCPTANGICLFDPLGTSITVKEGDVQSYRVFKLV